MSEELNSRHEECPSHSTSMHASSLSDAAVASQPKTTTLSRHQAIDLLSRLGADDDFRERFSISPGLALTEVGLSASEVAALPVKCLSPIALLDKSLYRNVVDRMDETAITATMTMRTPELRLVRK